MVSRTFKVGKAFGSAGVLAKATQAVPEAVGKTITSFSKISENLS